MTYLFVPLLRRKVRQSDVRMIRVVEFRACFYPSPIGIGFPRRNHGPAVERGAPSGSITIGNRNRLGRRCVIEPIDRNFAYAFPLQKDARARFRALGALCKTTGKHAPAKILIVADLVRDRHAATLSGRSNSARASRTNPSGSPRVSE